VLGLADGVAVGDGVAVAAAITGTGAEYAEPLPLLPPPPQATTPVAAEIKTHQISSERMVVA